MGWSQGLGPLPQPDLEPSFRGRNQGPEAIASSRKFLCPNPCTRTRLNAKLFSEIHHKPWTDSLPHPLDPPRAEPEHTGDIGSLGYGPWVAAPRIENNAAADPPGQSMIWHVLMRPHILAFLDVLFHKRAIAVDCVLRTCCLVQSHSNMALFLRTVRVVKNCKFSWLNKSR